MCGRFNLTQSPLVDELMRNLGIEGSQLRFSADCAPCTPINIVINQSGSHTMRDALWHLYLEANGTGFKPHPRYWSINTNYQQLAKKVEFKTARCLIPATAFVESQEGKNPYLLDFHNQPFCFGGLYKTWLHPHTGAVQHSASIITLAGHPKLDQIHRKSLPLIFNHDAVDSMFQWLDCNNSTTEIDHFLTPTLRHKLRLVAIDKSSTKNPIDKSFCIEADSAIAQASLF